MVRVLVPPEHLYKLLIVRDHLRALRASSGVPLVLVTGVPLVLVGLVLSHTVAHSLAAQARETQQHDGMAAPAAPRKRTNARCCGPQCRRVWVIRSCPSPACVFALLCLAARPFARSFAFWLLACLFARCLSACLFGCLFVCLLCCVLVCLRV